jgi:glycosyltransferase involved in cell wall biosynthesis
VKVCYAVLHYDPTVAGEDPEAYLARVPIHRELPREIARLGHDVRVVHAYPTDRQLRIDGVRHEFVSPGRIARLISAAAVTGSNRDRAIYEPAWRAIERIRGERPDLIHFHGMTLTWNLGLLLARLRPEIPVVLHYHGGDPARNPVAHAIQARSFRRASAFLFTTRSHGQPFVDDGLADPGRVVEIVETSTTFPMSPRVIARQKTGMTGDPVFVWTGRLDPIKDPLTALRGFAQIAASWQDAHLYLYYLTDPLLPTLTAFVAEQPQLVDRVHFRGRAPANAMEDIYNSADFLLQASRREVCGQAVLEAMASGVIPVVTDIPSFRAMTAGGSFGILFPEGDARALAGQTLAVPRSEIPKRSAAIRHRFEQALSFPALARQLDAVYRRLGA